MCEEGRASEPERSTAKSITSMTMTVGVCCQTYIEQREQHRQTERKTERGEGRGEERRGEGRAGQVRVGDGKGGEGRGGRGGAGPGRAGEGRGGAGQGKGEEGEERGGEGKESDPGHDEVTVPGRNAGTGRENTRRDSCSTTASTASADVSRHPET